MTALSSRKLWLLTSVLILGAGVIFLGPKDSVLIESVESKTIEGHPVFNRIELRKEKNQDTWIMHQSHGGKGLPHDQWDEIRITVTKKVARFQQIKNGEEVELKAACYTCHANGPRAIRPKALGLRDSLTVASFNLRMKLYGKVKVDPATYTLKGKFREVPFAFAGKRDLKPLLVKTCVLCHNADTFWGRGELKQQHAGTIRHLVKNGDMPPWPFRLSQAEKQELKRFVRGL